MKSIALQRYRGPINLFPADKYKLLWLTPSKICYLNICIYHQQLFRTIKCRNVDQIRSNYEKNTTVCYVATRVYLMSFPWSCAVLKMSCLGRKHKHTKYEYICMKKLWQGKFIGDKGMNNLNFDINSKCSIYIHYRIDSGPSYSIRIAKMSRDTSINCDLQAIKSSIILQTAFPPNVLPNSVSKWVVQICTNMYVMNSNPAEAFKIFTFSTKILKHFFCVKFLNFKTIEVFWL